MEKGNINYSELGKEKTVTVGELWREIGRRFWVVIILAVVFALIFGAYKYYRDSRDAEKEASAAGEIVVDDSLTDEEITEVENILRVKENMADLQNYIDNSVLMQIDASNVSTVVLQYRIEVPTEAVTEKYEQDLMAAYQSYIENKALVSDLTEDGYDVDEQYLGELIDVSIDSGTADSDDTTSEEEEAAARCFTVQVIHEDQESAEELADLVEEQIDTYQNKLTAEIGSHTLTLLNRAYVSAVDTGQRTYKSDRIGNILSMQDRVEEMEEDLSSAQQELLQQYEDLGITSSSVVDEDTEEDAEQTTVRISRRYVLLGAVVGIVVAIILLIVICIMRGCIMSPNDIRRLYNLRVLGELKLSGNGRVKQGGISMAQEQQMKVLLANLKNVCAENGIKEILFGGSTKWKEDDGLAEQLGEEMAKVGIKTTYIADLPYSAEAIGQLDEWKTVVLLEKNRDAAFEMIEAEIRTCLEHEARIVGVVVFS